MTHSKIERLRKELIEKHGDRALAAEIAPEVPRDRALINLVDTKTNKVWYVLRISNIIIQNSADLKEVERIINSGTVRNRRVDAPPMPVQQQEKGAEQ